MIDCFTNAYAYYNTQGISPKWTSLHLCTSLDSSHTSLQLEWHCAALSLRYARRSLHRISTGVDHLVHVKHEVVGELEVRQLLVELKIASTTGKEKVVQGDCVRE